MKGIVQGFVITLAAMLLPLALVHQSMKAQAERVVSMTAVDMALWQGECQTESSGPAGCSKLMLTKAKTVAGVALGAAEVKKDRAAPLTEADKVLIQMYWRTAYVNESNGSIYSFAANACANALGYSCPDFLEIGSWKHSERLMALVLRD